MEKLTLRQLKDKATVIGEALRYNLHPTKTQEMYDELEETESLIKLKQEEK